MTGLQLGAVGALGGAVVVHSTWVLVARPWKDPDPWFGLDQRGWAVVGLVELLLVVGAVILVVMS
jgi:hypothetical protein